MHQEEIREKTQIISKYEAEITTLKADLASSQDDIKNLKQSQDRLQTLTTAQDKEIEILKLSVTAKTSELEQTGGQLKQIQSELTKASEQLANYLSHIIEL